MSDEYVYVLRCCAPDMTSYDGFRWPESGPVEAPCWDPEPCCGFGLHGWLWGDGDASVSAYVDDNDARWLVVRVNAGSVVDLDGKVKFPCGEVVFCGDRAAAAAEIVRLGASGTVIGAMVTAGYSGTATAGDRGTATAGDGGTATAGDYGEIRIRWWGGSRYRLAVGYVGEDGIEAGVPYVVRDGRIVKKEGGDA